MKIGLIADVHYCSREILLGVRFPQIALQRLRQAMTDFRAAGAELVVCLGDLINIEDGGMQDRENLRKASAVLRESRLPCVCLMGNHDCEAFTREEFAALSGLTIAPTRIEREKEVLHFLDANYTPDGVPLHPPTVDWTKTFVPADQEKALQESLQDTNRRHFVFCHQCLDPQVESRHIVSNAAALRTLLAAGNVPAVFQGHFHAGAHHAIAGVSYITLPALCQQESALLIDTDAYESPSNT